MNNTGENPQPSDLTARRSRLSEVARLLDYNPQRLDIDDIPPMTTSAMYGSTVLKDSFLTIGNRTIFFGDSHGLIFPMLDIAVQSSVVPLPLTGTIVNADYHADVYRYSYRETNHYRSWERYGVDKGFWSLEQAVNFKPHNSTAVPDRELNRFTRLVRNLAEASKVNPQVLSVDLDFFMKFLHGTEDFDNHLKVLMQMARQAQLVMVFSSSPWNYDAITREPRFSQDKIQEIVLGFKKAFAEGSS